MDDIKLTSQLLNETKRKKESSLSELETLQKQILIREELITNMTAQIRILKKNITETTEVITALENDLEQLKEEYAKVIYYTYKHHNAYNKLLFIFASSTFNEAYYRLKYMRRYAEFRKKQAELILFTKKNLAGKIALLEEEKAKKQQLFEAEKQQKETLNLEKEEKDKVFASLRSKEKQLLANLKSNQRNASKLDKAIERIIKKELAVAKRKAAEAEKKATISLAPEAAELSAGFASNRGALPWPVERGVITGTFGEHAHPVLKTVRTRNNGIDIKTNQGAPVRSLFDGVVANIVFNPGFHKAVIIRHGDYFSVYSNLDEAFVKPGDEVKTKQAIGVVYTDEAEAKTEMHLEIWRGTTKLNPTYWIFKQ